MNAPIRIFVSSPGDVSEERGLARQVLERLRMEFASQAMLDTFFWEHEPLTAGAGFQEQLPLPSEHDLVITILWSRIGTRLHPRYAPEAGREPPTGTEFEVEDALRSWRQFKRPDILMFVCTAPVVVNARAVAEAENRIDQQKRVTENGALSAPRFTYRLTASELANRAADHVPADSQAFAAMLCQATGWLLGREPTLARKY